MEPHLRPLQRLLGHQFHPNFPPSILRCLLTDLNPPSLVVQYIHTVLHLHSTLVAERSHGHYEQQQSRGSQGALHQYLAHDWPAEGHHAPRSGNDQDHRDRHRTHRYWSGITIQPSSYFVFTSPY